MHSFSLDLGGRAVVYDRPAVMGIINVTPDSFYGSSRVQTADAIAERAAAMVRSGADIIDVGAYSSRPGADDVPEAEECARFALALPAIRRAVGSEVPVSVDTFRSGVARRCVLEWGADIVNDISGGLLDPDMFRTVAELRCPYVLMHMRGTPATMQSMTDYGGDVTSEVISELSRPLWTLAELGVTDVIIDPGFGFAKTLEQNYELLRNLRAFGIFDRPILVGVSRKSMITRLLGISADEALTATAVIGALAIERGASILRVHDPAEAAQTISILKALDPCLISE